MTDSEFSKTLFLLALVASPVVAGVLWLRRRSGFWSIGTSDNSPSEYRLGGRTPASQSVLHWPVNTFGHGRTPEMTILNDMDDYPAIARCSCCGAVMPTRQKWFHSAADNLAWFADQFRLHLVQEHSESIIER